MTEFPESQRQAASSQSGKDAGVGEEAKEEIARAEEALQVTNATLESETINRELIRLARRAETRPSPLLAKTFVDVGHLLARLSTDDHQIVYGRRGTGKTHVLYYLTEYAGRRRHAGVFIDLRAVGSAGGIYNDTNRPLSERGTALLIDVLGGIHSGLYEHVFASRPSIRIQTRAVELLDLLADNITQTRVVGDYEEEATIKSKTADETSDNASIAADFPKSIGVNFGTKSARQHEKELEVRQRVAGASTVYVHFGAVHRVLGQLVEALPSQRLWLVLDEWSHVPLDLQPLLADLLRRSILPVRGVTVKIGAIEDRSWFRFTRGLNDYVGLELGADISADVDLDDSMSYARNPQQAKRFFGEMFHTHLAEVLPDDVLYGPPREVQRRQIDGSVLDVKIERPKTAERFLNRTFRYGALPELARAAEGIPRDAISIVANAAQQAADKPISERQILRAAREWYIRDKERPIGANSLALALLHWLVDEIVGRRHATAFFLRQDTDARHPMIRHLYDGRVIHFLDRDVAANDVPNVRFALYKLDYGAYLDVTPGRAAPGTFRADRGKGPEWISLDDLSPRYESLAEALVELRSIPLLQANSES